MIPDAKYDYGSQKVEVEREKEIHILIKQLTEVTMATHVVTDQLQQRLEMVSGVPTQTPPREDKKQGAISPLGTFLVDHIYEIERLKQRLHNIINSLQI